MPPLALPWTQALPPRPLPGIVTSSRGGSGSDAAAAKSDSAGPFTPREADGLQTPSEAGGSYMVPAPWPSPSARRPAKFEMTPPPPGSKYGTRLSFTEAEEQQDGPSPME